MDTLILKLAISLALANPNSQIVVHPIAPEVCSSVSGVLDTRRSCIFPQQAGRAEVVIAVPTITGCDIRDSSDDSVLLSSDKSCDITLGSIAELRKQTFLERLKQLFQ